MKKKLINFFSFLILLCFSLTINAQAVWESDFADSLGTWEVEAVMDTFLWKWVANGDVSNGAFAGAGTAINSPTASNGAAVFNYDFEHTGGDGANAPAFPYPDAVVDLISPIIDLSAETGQYGLEFYQLIRRLNSAPGTPFSSYSLSRDGGVTWEDAIDVNPTLSPNADPVLGRVYFPLANVAGEDSLRIKFTYAGDFYYWVVDDVAIIQRPDNDMQANENFFAVPINYETPISQVEPIYFLADIENVGGAAQENVNLTVDIQSAGADVFTAVQPYGTIGVDSLAENVIFDDTFIPDEKGIYTGTYTLTADGEDSRPENNILNFEFVISDTTFAKEGGATRSVAPADDDSYEYGNVFYVPNGSGWYARYLSFQVNNADELVGRTITTYLYKWNGVGVEEYEATEENLEVLKFNSHTFVATDDGQLITIPVDLDGEAVELEDNTYYIVSVEYVTDDDQAMFLAASEAANYGAAVFIADSLNMERFGAALDVGNTGTLGMVGFGFDIVPVIRLHIGDNPNLDDPAVSTLEPLPAENLVSVFPNPADEQLSLALDLTEVSKEISVLLFDVKGRLVARNEYQNLQKETLTYNVTGIAPGTYFLQVITDQGARVQKFVVK